MRLSSTEPTDKAKLLIVDDDSPILSQLELALGKEFAVRTADSPEKAWEAVRQIRPDLITLDLALDGKDPETGFSFLERCLRFDPYIKVVMITGNDQETNALRAVNQGAADFLPKPVDLEELRFALRRYHTVARLERENSALLKQLGDERRLGTLLGVSPEMKAVFETIKRVAPVDVAVLILGESGTGKELVAKEICHLSTRFGKPFVSINCGAIPENLLESELFGHEKGAFTGAHKTRMGQLEMADRGIVFLDEIGDLPHPLQVKLLRFLQNHEIQRVGGRTPIELDVRVVAATNADLEHQVRVGSFREDLFYRLSVVTLRIPPLRERSGDVLFLAQYFLERFRNESGRGPLAFTAGAKKSLEHYHWPGNVRELEHHVQKAVLMSSGRLLDASDLELEEVHEPRPRSLREARKEADRTVIIDALRGTGGNISRAARVLEISRPSLHELLAKLKIDARSFKPRAGLPPEQR